VNGSVLSREPASPTLREAVAEYLATIRSGWRPWVLGFLIVSLNVAVHFSLRPFAQLEREQPELFRALVMNAPFWAMSAGMRSAVAHIVYTGAFLLLFAVVPVLGWLTRRASVWLVGALRRPSSRVGGR
jgi:hypothetical protein